MKKLEELSISHNEVPFSKRLNRFVNEWFVSNKHLFSQYSESQFDKEDPQKTFEIFKDHWERKGTIPMWYDENDDNIFGDKSVNARFRAWHDFMHIITNNDFSLKGERNVYEAQKAFLPSSWYFERALIRAEIVGQAEYYTFHGLDTPIPSQRKFTIDYITLTGY